MPVYALPSPHGIGTFGRAAYDFADFLHAAGQGYWQMLPLGPTSYGDSPYQSFSTYAGNPYFIDLDELAADSGVDQLATYGIDAKSFIAAYLDGFDYRIDEVKVDGDSATATVVLTCKKFDAFAQALTETTTELAEDEQTAELDADQINEKVGQLVLEALGSVEPTESNPVELPFTRTDNAWGPASGAEQALSTALFSG